MQFDTATAATALAAWQMLYGPEQRRRARERETGKCQACVGGEAEASKRVNDERIYIERDIQSDVIIIISPLW